MKAQMLIDQLTSLASEHGVDLDKLDVNLRGSDDSDVKPILSLEEDLYDDFSNNKLCSVVLSPKEEDFGIELLKVKYDFYKEPILVQRIGKNESYDLRVSPNVNFERDLGSFLYKGETIQMLEFDHTQMVGEGTYELADGYIFINHTEDYSFDSYEDNLEANLRTIFSNEEVVDIWEMFFGKKKADGLRDWYSRNDMLNKK